MRSYYLLILLLISFPCGTSQPETTLRPFDCMVFSETTVIWPSTEVLCIISDSVLDRSGIDTTFYEPYLNKKTYKTRVVYETEFYFHENTKGMLVLTNNDGQKMIVDIQDPYELELKQRLESQNSLLREELDICESQKANKTVLIAGFETEMATLKSDLAQKERIIRGSLTQTDCQEVDNAIYGNATVALGRAAYKDGIKETLENIILIVFGFYGIRIAGWIFTSKEPIRKPRG